MPTSDRTTERVIQSLYVGWFNRIGETSGVNYWKDQFDGGGTAITMSDGFWSATDPNSLNIAPWNGYRSLSAGDKDAFVQLVYWYVMRRSLSSGSVNGVTTYNG